MARLRTTALLLVMSTACARMRTASLTTNLEREADEAVCSSAVQKDFENESVVLSSNPSGLLDLQRHTILKNASGDMCLYDSHSEVMNRRLVFETGLKVISECCSSEERQGIGSAEDGTMLPFSENAFALIGTRQLMGVKYSQIQPDTCPESGCPLIVEVAGHEGWPWLQVRYFCSDCASQLGVVVISPTDHEYTGMDWVNSTFIPWVRQYLETSAIVDKERVYLVTESKGNEIGLSAALSAPDIFTYALFNGKFRFTADVWSLVQSPGIFTASKAAGLTQLSFHVGDEDPVFPDEDFFANFTAMLAVQAMEGTDVPNIDLHIYPGRGHDTSFGVWSKMSPVIWEGSSAPF